MGLDMYLEKEYYTKNWEYMSAEEKHTITILKGDKPSEIPVEKICSIITEEMYWRKANAIHQWFVKNVQDGEDDCGDYYVDTDQLQELLNIVVEVLADHSKATELLPTQSGFFFGGTEYDKYYFKDLEYTREGLTRILSKEDDGEFQYHSSW